MHFCNQFQWYVIDQLGNCDDYLVDAIAISEQIQLVNVHNDHWEIKVI